MAPQPILLSAEAVAKRGIHIKNHEAAFRENSATIVMQSKEAAFLNPVQEFNRDLSTLAIIAWSQILDREKKQRYMAHIEARNAKRAKRGEPETKRAKMDEDYRPYQFTILEALSATGLRSIRYAKEIPLLGTVLANDLSQSAVQAMRRNLALNFPPDRPLEEVATLQTEDASEAADTSAPTSGSSDSDSLKIHPDCKVHVNQGDAIALMYEHRDPSKRFDVVDLDPYGTAAPFLDAAVQSVADGGLLCVTCTDLAVLAGHNYPEKCWSLYGGVSVKAEYSHEVALRLVLHAIATAAGRYGRYIQPLLSLSIDFYLRVFVRVWTRPETVKLNASKTGLVYSCSKCSDFHIQPMGRATSTPNVKTGQSNIKFGSASGPPTDMRCGECGGTFHVGGPMWFGPIQDPMFCDEVLSTLDTGKHQFGTEARIRGMVSTARDVRCATHHRNSRHRSISTRLKSRAYSTARLRHWRPLCTSSYSCSHALLNAGFDVSRSHCVAGSVKTNAPRAEIYDLFRTWIKANPVNPERLKEGSAAKGLLARRNEDDSPATRRSFDYETPNERTEEVINGTPSANRLVRYQMNPQANWGPGTAAKGHRKKQHRSLAPEEIARRAQEMKEQEKEKP